MGLDSQGTGTAFSDLAPQITPQHCLLVGFSHLTDITDHITQNNVILFCFPSFLPICLSLEVQDGCAGAAVTSDDVASRTDLTETEVPDIRLNKSA